MEAATDVISSNVTRQRGEEEEELISADGSIAIDVNAKQPPVAISPATTDGSNEDVGVTAAEAAHLFVFTNPKAGMTNVDRAHVERVVVELSKDSLFFQNSLKQSHKVDARIAELADKRRSLTDARRRVLGRQVEALVATLESQRELSRVRVVVDMDMFYAAVEMRDRPELRDKPLAVGGIGMLSTTNYIARRFGVRAAMPGFIGRELCPELVIVPPNFDKYKSISMQIREIVAEYDPNYRAMSLDEVYCDLTDYVNTHWARYAKNMNDVGNESDALVGSSGEDDDEEADGEANNGVDDEAHNDGTEEADGQTMGRVNRASGECPAGYRETVAAAVVQEIRRKIHDTTQLTASAGIAVNTMLAKICSDVNKPNGQYVLPFNREAVIEFIQKLPVRKIGGVGKVMEKVLGSLDITTGRDLYDRRVELFHVFTQNTASWLLQLSLGIHESSREPSERKGYSRERTFRGIGDPRWLEKICREMCVMLADDLERGGHGTRNVTLKLKGVDFSVRTRAISTARTLRTSDDLFELAVELLRKEMPMKCRLLGVRASSLVAIDSADSERQLEGRRAKQVEINHFTTTAGEIMDPFEALELRRLVEQEPGGAMDCGVKLEKKRRRGIPFFAAAAAERADGDSVPMDPFRAFEKERSRASGKRPRGEKSTPPLESSLACSAPATDAFQPCPICGRLINTGNDIAINSHIDACLNGSSASLAKAHVATRDDKHKQPRLKQFFNAQS